MKDEQRPETNKRSQERRRFLGLLGAAGALGLISPFRRGLPQRKELSLKEADFYRNHDLAG
ncbi:MAG: twin-arginine translocation signal domain-containing protein [Chromatiaceae bacterium]|jgi:hypothetical protein|nr:twin-arginine translocation signal domain-containing protein [Chromatiaceae bacterium]